MFGNSKKIKKLEREVEDLKMLCGQITSSLVTLMQEHALVTQITKTLLENQKVTNKLISTKHGISAANDDDDIIH